MFRTLHSSLPPLGPPFELLYCPFNVRLQINKETLHGNFNFEGVIQRASGKIYDLAFISWMEWQCAIKIKGIKMDLETPETNKIPNMRNDCKNTKGAPAPSDIKHPSIPFATIFAHR